MYINDHIHAACTHWSLCACTPTYTSTHKCTHVHMHLPTYTYVFACCSQHTCNALVLVLSSVRIEGVCDDNMFHLHSVIILPLLPIIGHNVSSLLHTSNDWGSSCSPLLCVKEVWSSHPVLHKDALHAHVNKVGKE